MCPQFNKSVVESAGPDFPRNVECKTMNSVSMAGRYYGNLQPNVKAEVYAFLQGQDQTVSRPRD